MKPKVPTLTRKDIGHYISQQKDMKAGEIDYWIDVVLEAIRELLMSADPEVRLELRDFGVFEVKMTKAKPRARNPKTGERLFVPSRRKTHFKPSKFMKNFLNEPLTPDEELLLLRRVEQEQAHVQAEHRDGRVSVPAKIGHEHVEHITEVEEHVLG